MKKILGIFMILLFSFGFSSCGETKHTHKYGSWETVKYPTCTLSGLAERKCECGHSETMEIPARGHNYVDGVCTVCGQPE